MFHAWYSSECARSMHGSQVQTMHGDYNNSMHIDQVLKMYTPCMNNAYSMYTSMHGLCEFYAYSVD